MLTLTPATLPDEQHPYPWSTHKLHNIQHYSDDMGISKPQKNEGETKREDEWNEENRWYFF